MKLNNNFFEDRINFTDMHKYQKSNRRIAEKQIFAIEKDIRKLSRCAFAKNYTNELTEELKSYENAFDNYSNAHQLGSALAYLNQCQRIYALYYMHTDQGKMLDERAETINKLLYVADLTLFTTLNYYNKNTFCLKWQDYQFYNTTDFKDNNVITHVDDCLNNVCDLISGIDKNDNTAVYQAYSKICSVKLENSYEDPFPEFK